MQKKNDHKTIQKLTDPKNRFQNNNIAKFNKTKNVMQGKLIAVAYTLRTY